MPWVCLVVVWFVWGSTYLGIRVAVQAMPPLLMAGSRYLIAGIILAPAILAFRRGKLPPLAREDFKSILYSAILLLVIGNGVVSYAEVQLASGVTAIIVATVPLWMLLIDGYLTRRIKPLALLGVAVGLPGVVFLIGTQSSHGALTRALLVLCSSGAWAFGSVLARRRDPNRLNPLYPALEMVAGGVIMLVVGILSGELGTLHLAAIGTAAITGYVWLILAGSIVGYSAYGYAVRTLPSGVVATYAYINPVVAVALGVLLLHEPLTSNVLIGGAAVIASVIVTLLANRAVEPTREASSAVREQLVDDAAMRNP